MALLLALSLMKNLVIALFILVCAALILIILLQKGRGGGLGAAFGGGGAGSLLGTKTGDFLTWVTITLVAGFLVLAVLMGKYMRGSESSSELSAPTPLGAETSVVDEPSAGTEAVDEKTDTTVETPEAATESPEEVSPPTEEAVEQAEGETETESSPIPAEELAEEIIN